MHVGYMKTLWYYMLGTWVCGDFCTDEGPETDPCGCTGMTVCHGNISHVEKHTHS
jgi:hypothetical protein